MNAQKLVCGYQAAQRLKQLGVNFDSFFYYHNKSREISTIMDLPVFKDFKSHYTPAPTMQELLDRITNYYMVLIKQPGGLYEIMHRNELQRMLNDEKKIKKYSGPSAADCAANALIDILKKSNKKETV